MTNAKQLMNLYDEHARAARKAKDFELSIVFSSCEDIVNNIMHGLPFHEAAARIKEIFKFNLSLSTATEKEIEGYTVALEILDEYTIIFDLLSPRVKDM